MDGLYIFWHWALSSVIEVEAIQVFPAQKRTQVQIDELVIGQIEESQLQNSKQLQPHNLHTYKCEEHYDVAGDTDEIGNTLDILPGLAFLLGVDDPRDSFF